MMKGTILVFLAVSVQWASAQLDFNDFTQCYPIGEDPNIRWMSSYTPQETIIFEGNPTARYSFWNNFVKNIKRGELHQHAFYVEVRPHLRMYTDRSLPVKMPSYRVMLGGQYLFKLKDRNELMRHLIGLSIESGHYSNGQSGSTFSPEFDDQTPESDSIYTTIADDSDLSAMLNRKNGNFSTNFTELIFNYRVYKLPEGSSLPKHMHSWELGYTLYHDRFLGLFDFGGYSDNDIPIYGRHRFHAAHVFQSFVFEDQRLTTRVSGEYISGAHPFVNPLRTEVRINYFPFSRSKAFGFTLSAIYGHDNYNIRFVDSGVQVTAGITWEQFPLPEFKVGL